MNDRGRRGCIEGRAEGRRGNGRRKFDYRNIRFKVARFKSDECFSAIGFKEPEAGQIRHVKERSQKLATDAVRFFSRGGGRADRNVVSMSLLDSVSSKLGTIPAENFFEVGKSLDLVDEGRIAPWEGKKLNLNTGSVISKTNGVEGRVKKSHKAMVGGAAAGREQYRVQGVKVRIGAI